ncbi:MAG: 30S ribosomal protein S20 [Proteobacteria bacterium]|nr:30S ribosomal protein S20 [Pseudomonadota bacterium]
MANHKSALKRHRQSEKKRIRNTAVKSTIKTSIKGVRESINDNNAEEAALQLKKANTQLDKAVAKGVLHRNNASRKISRLTTAVNAISSK